MDTQNVPTQFLLSLPPRMAAQFESLEHRARPTWFATSDPSGRQLGSGGGTAHLLAEAWRTTGAGRSFSEWLLTSRKLIVHSDGPSRQLPAYAATGGILLPFPVIRWERGQRLDQTLLDVQMPDYQRVLSHAPDGTAAMITSGDVLIHFGKELPPFPAVDVIGLGMWVPPEVAQHFGVFFTPRQHPSELAFYLQKPGPAQIRELAKTHLDLVDTGVWLLSARAVRLLMERSGWSPPIRLG